MYGRKQLFRSQRKEIVVVPSARFAAVNVLIPADNVRFGGPPLPLLMPVLFRQRQAQAKANITSHNPNLIQTACPNYIPSSLRAKRSWVEHGVNSLLIEYKLSFSVSCIV